MLAFTKFGSKHIETNMYGAILKDSDKEGFMAPTEFFLAVKFNVSLDQYFSIPGANILW